VALFSVVLGTWLFGQYDYWQKSRDSRREKSVEFLEETSKNLNAVLTDIFLCIEQKAKPGDDSLKKLGSHLFKQRFAVAIKSEAFLRSSTFSNDYERIVLKLAGIIGLLDEPTPAYKDIKTETDGAWQDAQGLLSKALSDAMGQPNSDLASKLFLPGTAGILLPLFLILPILGLIFWKERNRTPAQRKKTETEKTP
jgi:hypothetical protein